MQHPIHPDPERLAALAGGDPEATADGALAAHADACPLCGEVLRELRLLRTALSELPDLAPSRALQLVPPVAAEPEVGGRFGWLRRLAAPAMAAGAGLALVGAVGFGSVALSGMAASAGAPPDMAAEGRGGEAETASSEPAHFDQSNAPAATAETTNGSTGDRSDDASGDDGEEAGVARVDLQTPTPWLVLIGTGLVLLMGGLALRFAVQPRAG